ncbi:hypothetical protein SAMN05421829_10814 [Aromatoleum tolulyticum]|uniref:EF-hand domain-containing protein n=1 Tax=Aromatoleum tolulyticum TaxID=34027 RepID=A0A1N6WNQ6_9RHOO|nr:hypothetical protein [Aromatoleum tolulyticum]SIQ91680.1 hypothetical protein SAMN05421829_10814 [Aromatoleum tolulyticum]
MLTRLRRDIAHVTLPTLQFFTVAIMLKAAPGKGWGLGIGVLAASGLAGWLRSLGTARAISDTPTSRIASAAQGYVELTGRGRPVDGTPLLSPVNGLPVLWYRVETERRQSDGKWRHVSTYESDASFLLDDGSGVCAVDPEGADMMVSRKETYTQGDTRHTQWCLINQDRIYVLGEFATLGSVAPDFDIGRQTRDLLDHWKSDRKRLLERFDLDGDGEIDLREWELARSQARREVTKLRDEVLSAPEAHVVRKPASKSLFLVSDLDPHRLATRYRWWSMYHIAVFLASAAGAAAWFNNVGGLAR